MPGLVRWAGWLIVMCTLPAFALAAGRAEPASPGIPHPLPPSAGHALRGPLAGGPPGGDGVSPLPAVAADLAIAAAGSPPGAAILGARPARWSSTCLGLPSPGGLCGQALIDGWVVTVHDPAGGALTIHVGAGLARVAGGP